MLKLPHRVSKPRGYGITAIMDLGLPLKYLDAYLEDYHCFIDIAKFGIGSAYLAPSLKDKIKLFKARDIHVCFGGTLFEKFYAQSCLEDYFDYMASFGMDWIEISTGTIDIEIQRRVEMVKRVRERFSHFTIVGEVGCKQKERAESMTGDHWLYEIEALLAAGCSYVIIESRATGTGGIFMENGTLRTHIFDRVMDSFDHRKLIIEAPTHANQAYFINRLGANVNLGNIAPQDILVLESLRQGLRSETFTLAKE